MATEDGHGKKALSDEVAATIRNEILGGSGYGRPPEASRFKKGKSGNPRGRPRKAEPDLKLSDQPVLEAARRAAAKKIKLREGDQTREVPAYEALMEAAVTHGIKGNARYAGMAIDYIRQADEAYARDLAHSVALWTTYKEYYSAQLDEARRAGIPEPEVYPHPDDIVIDIKTGPKFLGPWDDEENKQIQHTVRTCEVFLMQDQLDRRSATRLDGSPVKEPGTALYVFNAINESLPPRLKYSDSAIFRLQRQFQSMSKRALLKELYAGWRSIRQPMPRGYISPDLSKAIPQFVAIEEFARDVISRKIDITAMSPTELAELIMARKEARVPIIERRLRLILEQRAAR